MAQTSPELRLATGTPDRMIALDASLSGEQARFLATDALWLARQSMPRVTGRTARRMSEASGEGWFGIYFPDAAAWFMEKGTKPRTMRSLAGKTIPMWVNDADGELRRKDPKIKTRSTEDGRTQVLIFRKAAKSGQRKTTRRKNRATGQMETTTVPMSYPGAPGRIASRSPGAPNTPMGEVGGQVQRGNVGVRWYHPGIKAMQSINAAITTSAFDAGMVLDRIYVVDGPSLSSLLERRR